MFGFLVPLLLGLLGVNLTKPPPIPTIEDTATKAEQERQRIATAERRRRAGRASTVLTGGTLGLASPAPPSGAKTLLGE